MVQPEPTTEEQEKQSLLKLSDVCQIMGCCPATASKLMHETGHWIEDHGRLFIFEDRLMGYLRAKEGGRRG